MPRDSRTIIVSSLNRESVSNSNEVSVTLPDKIFSGKIQTANIRQLSINLQTEVIGNTNNSFRIAYPATSNWISIDLDIDKTFSTVINTDEQLAALISSSINATLGTTVFQCFYNELSSFVPNAYRDNFNSMCTYTIFTSNQASFKIDFNVSNTLGPLIGFGISTYDNAFSYTGSNIPPIYNYSAVKIVNKAFDTVFKTYDNPSDVACKFDLYDEDGVRIVNRLDARDATISLPIASGYIYSPGELAYTIQTEMNEYKSDFQNKEFSVRFDYNTWKFTFSNEKQFGISFEITMYGSMARYLGFDKKKYLFDTSYTSPNIARIFKYCYVDDYLLITSDLIKYNYDQSIIVAQSNNNPVMYESLFTISLNQVTNDIYTPINESEHEVSVSSCRLAKLYNENSSITKKINFKLLLASGRHIRLNTQWILKLVITYDN